MLISINNNSIKKLPKLHYALAHFCLIQLFVKNQTWMTVQTRSRGSWSSGDMLDRRVQAEPCSGSPAPGPEPRPMRGGVSRQQGAVVENVLLLASRMCTNTTCFCICFSTNCPNPEEQLWEQQLWRPRATLLLWWSALSAQGGAAPCSWPDLNTFSRLWSTNNVSKSSSGFMSCSL